MSQLQGALDSAIATVLVNATGAGPALAGGGGRFGGALAAADEPGCAHPQNPADERAMQLAVAVVLWNAQRHAPALRAACAGAAAAEGPGLREGPQPATCIAAPPPLPLQRKRARASRVVAAGETAAGRRGDEGPEREGQGEPGVAKRLGEKWSREQVEVMVRHVKVLPPDGGLAVGEAMQKLGLDGLPDPERRLQVSVRGKLCHMRIALAHGKDPLADNAARPARRNTYSWRAWLRKAFMSFPQRTGTIVDAAAFVEADPAIAPLLDRRPNPAKRDLPRWRTSITDMRSKCPEFEDTGQKRGRQIVFRYNEQLAEELAARKARAPRRGVRALPYMGKEQ